eukprot:scaffold143376_cov75-Phaeocystis_antarctica.AAC.3
MHLVDYAVLEQRLHVGHQDVHEAAATGKHREYHAARKHGGRKAFLGEQRRLPERRELRDLTARTAHSVRTRKTWRAECPIRCDIR